MKQLSISQYAIHAHPTSFMQTFNMAKQRQAQGQTTHFFQQNQEFVLLNGTPYPNSKYFNYNIWFSDHLSNTFLQNLLNWCKTHHGLSLTITPNTPLAILDNQGNVIKKLPFNQNSYLNNHLKPQGEIRLAPGTYKQWQYIIPLDQPYGELLNTFKPKVRHAISATKKTGIIVKRLQSSQIAEFTKTLSSTAERRHFSARYPKYYLSMLDAFGNDAYGLTAYIDPNKTRHLLEAIIQNSANIKDGPDIIKKAQKQLSIIKSLRKLTPVYAGFFVNTPRETVYLAAGGPDQYLPFSPVYAILNQAFQISLKRKIPRFNLYGTDATFDHPTGLLQFKQQFNGFIEQLPGDYSCTLRPFTTLTLKAQNHLPKPH